MHPCILTLLVQTNIDLFIGTYSLIKMAAQDQSMLATLSRKKRLTECHLGTCKHVHYLQGLIDRRSPSYHIYCQEISHLHTACVPLLPTLPHKRKTFKIIIKSVV